MGNCVLARCNTNFIGIDTANVISENITNWTATEDCYICGYIYFEYDFNSHYITIDGVTVSSFRSLGKDNNSQVGVCIPVKKGQVVVVDGDRVTSYVSAYKLKY